MFYRSGRRGVVVYDVVEEKTISLVKYNSPMPATVSKDDNNFMCRIAWTDQVNLGRAIHD